MKAVLQRVKFAKVQVEAITVGQINHGWLVLLGVTHDDTPKDSSFIAKKIIQLRCFSDEAGKFNHSLQDVQGSVLLVSQFTLYGDCRKGRRPSFTKAASPDLANELYLLVGKELEKEGVHTEYGQFVASMEVELTNDGPVTLILESPEAQTKDC